jgi:cytochrome c2/cytochrome c553
LRAIAEYLMASSKGIEPAPSPPGATEKPSAERGKRLFQIHGCLACHKHADFPAGQATHGPDLSRLGAKLGTPAGQAWLVSWLRDPVRHAPRTIMPNPLLAPEGKTDPAADVAAYLLASSSRQPEPRAEIAEDDLDALGRLYLGKASPQGDSAEPAAPRSRDEKLRYVGRRAIRKRGCFGCHDIPGFEDAQPIGPALTGWGRKQESLLAFEQVHRLLEEEDPQDEDEGFYLDAVRGKRREGFLWQKLRAPRSFDYRKTQNKTFNEQLLMGRFTLTGAQREAIVAFVAGLVSEPPKEPYLPSPDPRRKAILEGRKVLDKYACAGCHTLELERWTIEIDPEKFPGPIEAADYPFVKPQLPSEVLAASNRTDRRGRCRAELTGMPQWNAEGKLEETEDEDGNPQYGFNLWEPAAIAGKVWPVGGASVLVSQGQIAKKRPPRGGELARLLYPVVLAEAKSAGSTAPLLEAWGWVPPALAHEGRIVRPEWLYDYLLEPYVVRPAAVLRMPKYNLSPAEARALVDYFAAAAGAEFPYSSDPRARTARLEAEPAEQSARHDRAMRFLTDRNTYCAKCHLVGDYGPGGDSKTVLAPNLERVGRRIRPEYLRRWLANPRSVLPYTAMPVNFPPDKQMGQDLYPGTSLEQLDAVGDLLVNYDGYFKRRASIRRMVEESGKATK